MADILPDLPSFAGGVGALALLAWLVIRVMNQSSGDRQHYQDALARKDKAHEEQIQAITNRFTNQISELRGQVKELRLEQEKLRADLEEERGRRWAAEDAAAKYRRAAEFRDNDQSH